MSLREPETRHAPAPVPPRSTHRGPTTSLSTDPNRTTRVRAPFRGLHRPPSLLPSISSAEPRPARVLITHSRAHVLPDAMTPPCSLAYCAEDRPLRPASQSIIFSPASCPRRAASCRLMPLKPCVARAYAPLFVLSTVHTQLGPGPPTSLLEMRTGYAYAVHSQLAGPHPPGGRGGRIE